MFVHYPSDAFLEGCCTEVDSSSLQCDGRDFFHIHRRASPFASLRAPYFLIHAKARRREVLMFVHSPSDAFLEGRCTEVDSTSLQCDGRDFFHIHRRVLPFACPPYFLIHAKTRRREVLMFVHYPSDAFLEGCCTEVDSTSLQCDGRDFFHIHRRVSLRAFASSHESFPQMISSTSPPSCLRVRAYPQ